MTRRDSLKNIFQLIDSAKTELPIEESFLTDLKRSIELDASKGARKPSQSYKPSSMNCIRNMYYQIVGQDQDEGITSYTMVGITNSGSDIHERIQTYVDGMKLNGIDCEYVDVAEFVRSRDLNYLNVVSKQGMETKLYHKDLNMSFLTDGIIKYKGKYYILELKTEASFKFQSRKGVDPKHYNQGIAYSVAFGLNDMIFIYINRDFLDMKSYLFHVTDDMRSELVSKIFECDSYVEQLTVPPKPENITAKLCQYCGYQSVCKRDG